MAHRRLQDGAAPVDGSYQHLLSGPGKRQILRTAIIGIELSLDQTSLFQSAHVAAHGGCVEFESSRDLGRADRAVAGDPVKDDEARLVDVALVGGEASPAPTDAKEGGHDIVTAEVDCLHHANNISGRSAAASSYARRARLPVCR